MGVLESVLGLLGGLGGHLGRSWRPLGGSWRPLGTSWAVLGRHPSIFVVLKPTRPAGGPDGLRKGTQHGTPNATQNGPKSNTKTKTKTSRYRRPSWSDLRAILGRSWATPISKIVLSPRAGLIFLKNHVFEKVRCQEATWAELGPTWAPKRTQNGCQEGAKTEQKTRGKMK